MVRSRLTCVDGLLVQSKEMFRPSLLLRSKSVGACVDVFDFSSHSEACNLATSWDHVSRATLPWELC